MNKCEHCNCVFKTVKTMNQHQKTAKFCLIKQNKKYICEHCDNIFYSNKDFDYHKNNCIAFLKNEIRELKEENKDILYYQNEIEFYKKQLDEKDKQLDEKDKQLNDKDNHIKHLEEQIVSITKTAISKPTTTNNTHINNKIMNMSVLNLDSENIKNIINNKYNLDAISDGQKGIAKFATNFLLKDSDGNLNYVCTDPSRKIFKYKNNSGEVEKDVNAQKLTDILTENGILSTTARISSGHWTNEDGTVDSDKVSNLINKVFEINCLKEDNTIFKNELIAQTSI